MDFLFNEDQEMLRDTVRKWADKQYSFDHRRKVEKAGGVSADDWKAIADLGLCGLAVPEAQGGAGFGPQEAMVVMEELGRALVMEPFAAVCLVSASILREAQTNSAAPLAAKLLSSIADGSEKTVLAYQERALRYGFEAPACKAELQGDTWQLSGHKSLVAQAASASGFIVSAGMAPSGEMALFYVAASAQGLATTKYQQQDGSAAGEVKMSGVKAELLLRGEPARQALARAIDVGISAICAEAVGAMEKMFSLTTDYLNTRKQFGVPIGTFQSLRHRIADAKMQLELARSMSYFINLKLTETGAERSYAASQAKYQVGQSARWLGQQCVQMHGGIAVTDEYVASHYFKRLTAIDLQYGDSFYHLGKVSAGMRDTAGVFA